VVAPVSRETPLVSQGLPQTEPVAQRPCARCRLRSLHSTGRFRVNARGRRVDIWLIYRCRRCNRKWNARVLRRARVASIKPQLLQRFTDNDEALARDWAFRIAGVAAPAG